MSVPPDKLPSMLSIGMQSLRNFAQMGSSVRDNVKTPSLDSSVSMGLQFTESATSLPAMLSKGFAKINTATSVVQGGHDLVQGFRRDDTARTGSGMLSMGMVAVGVFSTPLALGTGTLYGVASFVAPDKTKAMQQEIGRATHQFVNHVKAEMSKPVDSSTFGFQPPSY